MLIISLATAGTVLTLNIYNRSNGDDSVPILVQRIFFGFVAKLLCMDVELKPDIEASVRDMYATLKAYYTDQTYEKMAQLKFLKNPKGMFKNKGVLEIYIFWSSNVKAV